MASDFRQKESRRPECDPLVADINYINESSVHVANYLSIRWAPNPSEPQISGATASNPNNIHLSPVLTDAIIPAPYPEAVTSHANMHHASSGLHTQNPLSSILPLQQFQYGNPTVRDEHGRLASTTQHVNGIPATPQVSSAAFLDTSGLSTAPFNGGSQQQFSRSHSNQIGVSQIASSSSQHCPGMQNAGSWSPTQPENMYQGPIAGSRSRRMSQLPNQSLGPIQAYIQSITNFPQPQVHQRGPQSGIYQETGTTCTHQAMSHSLGSIQSSMQFHTNFLQPQVHQQVQQNAICLGTEAIDDRQATNNTLSPIHSLMQSHANVPLPQVRQRGSQSGITQTTEAITSLPSVNHNTGQATNHTLSSIYSLMQSYANVPMPQVHQRGSQNGITQTTVAVSSLPSVNHNSGPIQSSMQLNANFLQPRVHPRGSEIGNGHATRAIGSQHSHFTVAAQRNAISSVIRPVEASRIISPFTTNSAGHRVSSQEGNSVPVRRHDLYDLAEQNWRPTSRMRGALTGQAYSDALSQYIIRPNQQAQAAQPFVSVTTPLSSIITSMQAHMDDRAAQNPGPMN